MALNAVSLLTAIKLNFVMSIIVFCITETHFLLYSGTCNCKIFLEKKSKQKRFQNYANNMGLMMQVLISLCHRRARPKHFGAQHIFFKKFFDDFPNHDFA